jgi:hypothetical protein
MPEDTEGLVITVPMTVHIQPNTPEGDALRAMMSANLQPAELIQAVVDGINPTAYSRARLLGHTDGEVRLIPELTDQVTYLKWRENHELTHEETLAVLSGFRTSSAPDLWKKIFRAVRRHGRSAAEAIALASVAGEEVFSNLKEADRKWRQADALARHSGQPDPGPRWKPRLMFPGFVEKALEQEPDAELNEIWRAWLVHLKMDPYDVSALVGEDALADS